jgi:hypothetical protein
MEERGLWEGRLNTGLLWWNGVMVEMRRIVVICLKNGARHVVSSQGNNFVHTLSPCPVSVAAVTVGSDNLYADATGITPPCLHL